MGNIMINKSCNLRCPYCFAEKVMESDRSCNMSLEDFEKTLLFLSKRPMERIGIIGGEPLLHPQFKEIMEKAIWFSMGYNTPIHVFSNGILLDRHFECFIPSRATVLINVNSPSIIGRDNFNRMSNNIIMFRRKLYKSPAEVSIGMNWWDPEDDYGWFLDFARDMGYSGFRLSISVPMDADGRDPIMFFRDRVDRIMEFFRKCKDFELEPRMDCNFLVKCVLSNDDFLFIRDNFPSVLSVSACTPVVDIFPDLKVGRCFGFGDEFDKTIDDFDNIWDIHQFFTKRVDYCGKILPSSKNCITCDQYATNNCDGGCLSFKKSAISNLRDRLDEMMGI